MLISCHSAVATFKMSCADEKKAPPKKKIYAPSLYVNTNPKTPVAYKIKSCHRVVATFGFRKNGLGFRKNHFGSVVRHVGRKKMIWSSAYRPEVLAGAFGLVRGYS